MNAQTKLPITFAPTGEQNSWIPQMSASNGETATGARALARFNVKRPSATRKFSNRSGVNAAPRISPNRCRYTRRRLFAPSHIFEHRLP
jgi:hypothetical protein